MLIGWTLCSTASREPLSIGRGLEGESGLRIPGRHARRLRQIMYADAQQTHGRAARVGALEQRHGTADDVLLVAGGVFGVAARDGREVVIAHLDGTGAGVERALEQPRRRIRSEEHT